MRRRGAGWLFVLLIIGCALTAIPVKADRYDSEQIAGRLLQALEATDAHVTEVEMRTSMEWGSAADTAELDQIWGEWLKTWDLLAEPAGGTWEKGMYIVQKLSNQQGVNISHRLIGVPKQGSYTVHVVLSIKGNRNQVQHMESIQKQAAEIVRKAGVIPQFSTCIRGIYSVKLSVDQQEGKILSVFGDLHAYERERLADETVVSISGFTRAWEPSIILNGQKMNLQVATHRDSQTEGTQITVGTPIITAEY